MSDIATVYQAVQLGVETVPGTSVAANKKPQVLTITPGIQADVQTYRPAGVKFATVAALGQEHVQASIEGPLDYEHIVYLLSSVMSYSAPIQQGTTTAYKWTHTIAQSSADTIKTYTVEIGSPARAMKFTYGLVQELTMTFTRNEATLSGTMIGQALQDDITMTASPTVIPIEPVLPTQVSVYLDTSVSNIGTTKLTRAFQAELAIPNRYNPIWVLDSAVSGFAGHVEMPIDATLTLRVEADDNGMLPLTYLRNGDPLFVRIKATGPTIADTYTYSLQLDVAGVVSGVSEFSDEDGVYAIEWTLTVAHTSGTPELNVEAEVVNTRSAL